MCRGYRQAFVDISPIFQFWGLGLVFLPWTFFPSLVRLTRVPWLLPACTCDQDVKFTGYVTEEEKTELLNSAKLFVVTSYSDVHTTTAIEAMAVGIPVVITKASDFPEIDLYEAGFTVESSQESIYNAIVKLLDNEEKIQVFSKNAKKLVNDKFLLENQIVNYEKMFMNTIHQKLKP